MIPALRNAVPRLLLAALLAAAAGCEDTQVVFDGSGLHAMFSTDQPSPGPLDVDLSEAFTSGDTTGIDVRVTSTNGVQAALFTLTYDPGPVRFASYAPGSILEADGVTPIYSIAETSSGFVQVDIRRPQAAGPAFVTGTETLVRINFQLKKSGDSHVGFLPPDQGPRELMNPAGAAIPGVDWFGGLVQVN